MSAQPLFQISLLLIALLVAGCGLSAPADDVEATLYAEANNIVVEATAIRTTAEAQSTQIAATIAAADAYLVQRRAVNAALLATARADIVPTAQVIANIFSATPDAILSGERWFVKTGTTTDVNASNGCAGAPQNQFSSDTDAIYATFEAHNIAAGTPLSADWVYEGQSVHRESFNIDRDYTQICLWFSIDQTTVPFTPGVWSVQLYAEVFPLEGPMLFTIR